VKANTFARKALRFADNLATTDGIRFADALRQLSMALEMAGQTSVSQAVAGTKIPSLPRSARKPTIADARTALIEFRSSLSAQDKRSAARDFRALDDLISGHDSASVSALVAAVRQKFASKAQSNGKRKSSMDQALITDFIHRLETSLGDDEKFKSVFAELEANSAIGKPEAIAIARGFMGKMPSTASRRAALDRIYSRHAALMDFKAKRKAFGGRTAA